MLTSDPDYYYSPDSVTQIVAEMVGRTRPSLALDSNCGGGALLYAVERGFSKAHCVGIDLDAGAIRRLRKVRPHWTLVEGDALSQTPWSKLRKTSARQVDVAVLNPPFSMGFNKGMMICLPGADTDLRCSLAMAHVLTTLERAEPRRVLAILPESLVHSVLDRDARELISVNYDLEVVKAFKSTTFRGARANSVLVAMNASRTRRRRQAQASINSLPDGIKLIRGGLPRFQVRESACGVPYVHTTDLGGLVLGRALRGLINVEPTGRGVITGHVVLLPRVGLPKLPHLTHFHFARPVQLSDCVIAITSGTERQARCVGEALREEFTSLSDLYRGTGARYVTIERLSNWLQSTLDFDGSASASGIVGARKSRSARP